MGSIQYNNTYLTNATLIKFLGLMIDSNLTWNHQVNLILRKLSSSCYALNYVKYTLPIDILKLIYFANVQSIMSYGITYLLGSFNYSLESTYLYCKRKPFEASIILNQEIPTENYSQIIRL
jgi:hypothetical protein